VQLGCVIKYKEVTMTKYIIVDIISQEFFKDVDGNVKIFNDYDDALLHCGIYEFENAWVCELKHNHIEDNENTNRQTN
jgi:hypothetical protein